MVTHKPILNQTWNFHTVSTNFELPVCEYELWNKYGV